MRSACCTQFESPPGKQNKVLSIGQRAIEKKKAEMNEEKKGSIRFILGKPGENYSYRCMLLRD